MTQEELNNRYCLGVIDQRQEEKEFIPLVLAQAACEDIVEAYDDECEVFTSRYCDYYNYHIYTKYRPTGRAIKNKKTANKILFALAAMNARIKKDIRWNIQQEKKPHIGLKMQHYPS